MNIKFMMLFERFLRIFLLHFYFKNKKIERKKIEVLFETNFSKFFDIFYKLIHN